MRFLNLFIQIILDLVYKNRSITRYILIFSFYASFFPSVTLAQEQIDNTIKTMPVEKTEKAVDKEFKRIRELGGEVLIDGSMRVLEPIYGKVFDLVEVSTPVTPSTNHARIFLRADGTKQTLVILYDDGTTDNIATNQ